MPEKISTSKAPTVTTSIENFSVAKRIIASYEQARQAQFETVINIYVKEQK
jgi:hypothetical protein